MLPFPICTFSLSRKVILGAMILGNSTLEFTIPSATFFTTWGLPIAIAISRGFSHLLSSSSPPRTVPYSFLVPFSSGLSSKNPITFHRGSSRLSFIIRIRQNSEALKLLNPYLIIPIKCFHRGLSSLIDIGSFQHLHHCNPNYLDVCPQTNMVNIPNIQLELFRP